MLCHFLGGTCNKAGFNRQGVVGYTLDIQTPAEKVFGPPKHTLKILEAQIEVKHFLLFSHVQHIFLGLNIVIITLDFAARNRASRSLLLYLYYVRSFDNPS